MILVLVKMISRNQDLFAKLQLAMTDEIYKVYNKQSNSIARLQKANRDKLLNEIAIIMLKYEISNEYMSLTVGDKRELNTRMGKFINELFDNEVKEETKIVNDILSDVSHDTYYSNSFIFNKNKVKHVHDNILKKILDLKIKGEHFSKRIWKNKNNLAKTVKSKIREFINGNISVNKITSEIMHRYDVNWNVSRRLVRTEICNVQTHANEVWAKNHNIKYQMFMATLDNKTSQRCRELDGNVYDMNDSNKPIPPLHVNCRSLLVNIVNKDWKPTSRIDNITKQRIDYVTYKDWEKKQNL